MPRAWFRPTETTPLAPRTRNHGAEPGASNLVCHGDGGIGTPWLLMCHGDGGIGTPWLLRTRWNTESWCRTGHFQPGYARFRTTCPYGTSPNGHAGYRPRVTGTGALAHPDNQELGGTRNHGVQPCTFPLRFARLCTTFARAAAHGAEPNASPSRYARLCTIHGTLCQKRHIRS